MTREIKTGLCGNLELWDEVGRGREVQEGGGICILMADSLLLYGSNHCKAVIFQLKKKDI